MTATFKASRKTQNPQLRTQSAPSVRGTMAPAPSFPPSSGSKPSHLIRAFVRPASAGSVGDALQDFNVRQYSSFSADLCFPTSISGTRLLTPSPMDKQLQALQRRRDARRHKTAQRLEHAQVARAYNGVLDSAKVSHRSHDYSQPRSATQSVMVVYRGASSAADADVDAAAGESGVLSSSSAMLMDATNELEHDGDGDDHGPALVVTDSTATAPRTTEGEEAEEAQQCQAAEDAQRQQEGAATAPGDAAAAEGTATAGRLVRKKKKDDAIDINDIIKRSPTAASPFASRPSTAGAAIAGVFYDQQCFSPVEELAALMLPLPSDVPVEGGQQQTQWQRKQSAPLGRSSIISGGGDRAGSLFAATSGSVPPLLRSVAGPGMAVVRNAAATAGGGGMLPPRPVTAATNGSMRSVSASHGFFFPSSARCESALLYSETVLTSRPASVCPEEVHKTIEKGHGQRARPMSRAPMKQGAMWRVSPLKGPRQQQLQHRRGDAVATTPSTEEQEEALAQIIIASGTAGGTGSDSSTKPTSAASDLETLLNGRQSGTPSNINSMLRTQISRPQSAPGAPLSWEAKPMRAFVF